jgi:uncharacterized membrane protein
LPSAKSGSGIPILLPPPVPLADIGTKEALPPAVRPFLQAPDYTFGETAIVPSCARHAVSLAYGRASMNDLLVIAFSSEQKAEDVRQKLFQMQKEYLIELGDAVVAVKDPEGHIKLNQLFNTTAIGGVSGMFWGALIGLIFMMPLAGAALGAASGAVSGALTDFGIDDKFMKDVAEAVPPGGAALFVLVRKMTTDKVLEGLRGVGGTVLRTSFEKSKDDAIRAALAAQTPTS